MIKIDLLQMPFRLHWERDDLPGIGYFENIPAADLVVLPKFENTGSELIDRLSMVCATDCFRGRQPLVRPRLPTHKIADSRRCRSIRDFPSPCARHVQTES
jgi:hypothetical protein